MTISSTLQTTRPSTGYVDIDRKKSAANATTKPENIIYTGDKKTSHNSTQQTQLQRAELASHSQSPNGMPSTPSTRARQQSACSSAYLTLSCAQSWCVREMRQIMLWKKRISSRTHSLMKTPRACWLTIDCLSCESVTSVIHPQHDKSDTNTIGQTHIDNRILHFLCLARLRSIALRLDA